MPRTAALALCGWLALAALGCGADDGEPRPQDLEPPRPGSAGTLEVAIGSPATSFDPLTASGATALVARQATEPLWSPERAPYQAERRGRGPAAAVTPSRGGRQWSIRLRPGVRFHDGRPLDGQAVLANVSRWLESDRSRGLLEAVVDADAPRPDLVRLFCDRPLADLDERLASRRLGLVSPSDISPGSLRVAPRPSGTGPYEYREGEAGRLTLARNVDWWGSRRGLGPAFDQLRFVIEADAELRLASLERGSVGLAELSDPELAEVDEDPLLHRVGAIAGLELGASRSLRGVATRASLAGAWPTTVGVSG